MSQDIPSQNAPAVAKAQPVSVSHAQALFDTDKFVQMQRAAQALMHSTVLPESIRGNTPEQCFSNLMVAFDLADRLRTTPISVTQCMSIVHGKILLEGKLVQAAIDNVLGIELYPWWTGERGTDGYRIFLSDKPWDEFTDEQMAALKPGQSFRDRKVVDGSVGEWKTYGKDGRTPKPAWVGIQTQNQLLYRSTREWARRYAPTIMLGVYTDDEIDAAEERRIDRASAPRIVGGLSGGFAVSQPDEGKPAEEVVDAVVEDLVEEGTEDATTEDQTENTTEDQEGTTEGEDASEDEEQEELTPERRAELLEQARDITRTGLSFAINMAWPEDFIAELETACEVGSAEYDEAQASAAAQPVEETAEPDDHNADAGKMVEESDQDGDTTEMIKEATPVEAWSLALESLGTWREIKQAIYDLSTGPIWPTLSPEQIAEVRRLAWARMNYLIETTKERQDFLEDLTAFRCWIEWYGEAEGIEANWTYVQETKAYRGLPAESKRTLAGAVEGRIRDLEGEDKGAPE